MDNQHLASKSICFLLIFLLLAFCTPNTSTSTPTPAGPQFTLTRQSGIFTVHGTAADAQAIQDVLAALEARAPQIQRDLSSDDAGPVTVELFPDQASLDRFGMNPEMHGFYAYSGTTASDRHVPSNRRIQMVSPRNPIPTLDIGYTQRVEIAVHEYTHLLLDTLNPHLPLWLDEGVAASIGPSDLYRYVCAHRFPFDQIPAFSDLEQSYAAVPAADLFAYAAVDFIHSQYGLETLNRLIREPASFEAILGLSRAEFELRWLEFMRQEYSSGM